MTITRSTDHGTVSLRGNHLALDIIVRGPEHKRAGLQVVIDDDPHGHGVQTRLHVYGTEAWGELVALVKMAETEIGK